MVPINSSFIGKTETYLHHTHPKLQNALNEIQLMVIFIVQIEYHQTVIKEKFMNGNYALHFINSLVNEFQKGKQCGDKNST